ncbi:mechanosensitive ion channel [Anaerolineales bacterium HSG24]|nr:mechanosensitive ion channel [Anaerolineales bacterium HSG24]
MFEEIIQDNLTIEQLNRLLATDMLRQLLAFVLILLLTTVAQNPLLRILRRIEKRSGAQTFIKGQMFFVLGRTLLPLTAQVIGNFTIIIFQELEWSNSTLSWLVSFLTIWFLYCLADSLIRANLPPIQATFWSRSILLPVTLIVTALSSIGLLDSVLALSMTVGQMGIRFTLRSMLAGIAIVIVAIVISRGVRQVLKNDILPRAGAQPALSQALSMLASYAVILGGVAVGLSAIGIDLTTITVILGGLSVGLGFGLQEIVSNLVSGFILMFEQAIAPGDVIKIGDAAGEVTDVGVRSITILTKDNVELIVPNSYFLTEIITSLTRTTGEVRVGVKVGVSYNTSPKEAEAALLEAASRHSTALKTPTPQAVFLDFGSSSLDFELLVWTDKADEIPFFASELRHHIWDALAEQNIEIPFPQQDLHVRTVPVKSET